MKVLSLFDGISCARVAVGDRVTTYYASEIDKHAITISQRNYPDIIRLGDVREVTGLEGGGTSPSGTSPSYGVTLAGRIDLLIGGSPCQDLSIAKKNRKGLDGDRSGLFWEYVRVLREVKPRWFILENVASMPKADRDIITRELGVEPILIDAARVSAQSRKRLFWTNIPGVTQPADRGIVLRDILEDDDGEVHGTMTMLPTPKQHAFIQIGYFGDKNACGVGGQALRVYSTAGKSTTSGVGLYQTGRIRRLTPVECERLQGLPDGYTAGIAKTHRYKALANAFHVEVIKHILSFAKLS